jgi:hypothetical protein
MAKKTVKFKAFKTVAKPVKVKFQTKSGETISFKALRTFEKKRTVRFRATKRG